MNTFDQTVQRTSGRAAGLDVVETGGYREDLTRGYGDLLGISPAGQQRADSVADLPLGDPLTDRRDGTCALQAEDVRGAGWRWVVAFALHDVGPVERRRGDRDDDLARHRLRVRDLHHLEDLWAAGPFADDRPHQAVSAISSVAMSMQSSRSLGLPPRKAAA